jgi:uncharacterized protein YwqG
MKIHPIKTKEDYIKFTNYLDSLYGIDLNEEQTNNILIIQQLLEHYEQNNMSKVSEENFDSTENLDYIYELINNVSSLEKGGLIERVCKLQEEVGKLSAEALKSIGFKNSTLSYDEIKRNILLESTDCLIMCLDILSHQGFSKQEIIEMADKQIDKWLSNLKNN